MRIDFSAEKNIIFFKSQKLYLMKLCENLQDHSDGGKEMSVQ